jgi:hypothetical protein
MALQSPIDFLAGTPIMSGRTPELISQLGGAIRSRQAIAAEEERNRLMQAQQTAEAQERQRQEAAISGLAAIENPTYQDYEKVALTLPKQRADSIRASFAQMNKDQQQNQLKFHGEILAAIDSNPDIAVELLDERAELERNAGDEEEATELERMALAIEEGNADNVKKKLGIITAFMPGGKEALDAVAKLRGTAGLSKEQFERAQKLSTRFEKASGEFIKTRDAFARVQASAKDPSAAGDLALIFNFMKVLDPGSTVREGEFATAQNAAGVPERVRAQFNRVFSGERLTEKSRGDFTDRSTRLFKTQDKLHKTRISEFKRFAKDAGVPEESVIIDLTDPETLKEAGQPVAQPAEAPLSTEEQTELEELRKRFKK